MRFRLCCGIIALLCSVPITAQAQTSSPENRTLSAPTASAPAATLWESVAIPYADEDPKRMPLSNGGVAPDFTLPLMKDGASQKLVTGRDTSSFLQTSTQNNEYSINDQTPQLQWSRFHQMRRETSRGKSQREQSRVTMIMFWAFWCDTWEGATRSLRRMKNELEKNRVDVLCVAVDASQQPVAQRAIATGDLWFPVVIDAQSEVTQRYGVRRVPTLFLVDNSGKIRAHFENFPSQHALLAAVKLAHQGKSPAKK
jgi:peroxiredoxin